MNSAADSHDIHVLVDSTSRSTELPSLLRDFLADYQRNGDFDHDLEHESDGNELAISEQDEDLALGGLLGHSHAHSPSARFYEYDYYPHFTGQHEFHPHEMQEYADYRRDDYKEFHDYQPRQERFTGMAGAAPEYYPADPFPNTLLFPEQQVSQSSYTKDKKNIKKRQKHVGKACQHCKKAHLACDVQRPCKRCVHLQKKDCIDVEHKKRGRPRTVRVKE